MTDKTFIVTTTQPNMGSKATASLRAMANAEQYAIFSPVTSSTEGKKTTYSMTASKADE